MRRFFRPKQKPEQTNADIAVKGIDLVMQMIFMQLPLCGLDPLSLCKKCESDDFALGYVFGIADMGNHQFNPDASNQAAALVFIREVFVETLGGDGEDAFFRALEAQHVPKFAAGRQIGADDLGNWMRSEGKRGALGLARHIGFNQQEG